MKRLEVFRSNGEIEGMAQEEFRERGERGEWGPGDRFRIEGTEVWRTEAELARGLEHEASPYAAPRQSSIPPPLEPAAQGLRTVRPLSTALMALAGACAVTALIGIAIYLMQYQALHEGITEEEAELMDQRSKWQSILAAALFLATVVVYLCWKVRLYGNARLLTARPLEYTNKWVVLSYFIPILNLFRPFQMMKEIWLASAGEKREGVGLLRWWWGFWLVSNWYDRVIDKLYDPDGTLESFRAYSANLVVGQGIYLVLCLLLMLVAGRLWRGQEERMAKEGPVSGEGEAAAGV